MLVVSDTRMRGFKLISVLILLEAQGAVLLWCIILASFNQHRNIFSIELKTCFWHINNYFKMQLRDIPKNYGANEIE
jgi:hypothetical protein